MKLKKSAFCLLGAVVALAVPTMSSCGTTTSSSSKAVSSATSSVTSSTSVADYSHDTSKNVGLTMSCYYNSTDTMMTYSATNIATISSKLGGTIADGSTPKTGDFKPVWAQVQKDLNFTITDVTNGSDGSVDTSFSNFQKAGFKTSDGATVNILQGNATAIEQEGTTNGTILNLTNYLDKMPNFKRFLQSNKVVEKSIIDSSGAIYYAPYFDGMDDMEKTLLLRKDWVVALLDGDLPATLDTDVPLAATEYTRFNAEAVDQTLPILGDDGKATTISKKYTAGNDVITLQNALSAKTGASLVKTLRDYIDSTYGNAYGTTRSALFVGGKASFNIDELVALYRCVRTNPTYLTGTKQDIFPLIPREQKNTRGMDLHNFMMYFGCQGFNSRQTYYYVGNDGKVHDIRKEDKFVTAVNKMHAMYDEGLILPNFSELTAGGATGTKGDFSTQFIQKADRAFSEYDYVQTQTILNVSNAGMALVPVYPAAYAWDGAKESRYTDSWRSVKSQGWFITAATADDADKLDRALALFDYFYSKDGNKLMSYGPADWVDGTITYMGRSVPKLSAACLNELSKLASGNYTNYYRQFLGGTFPIGYVKEQGMEYQTVDATAQPYLDTFETALSADVIAHPSLDEMHHTDHMADVMPTTLPFTSGEQTQIKDTYSGSSTYFYQDTKGVNVISKIIMNGFAGADSGNWTTSDGYMSYIDSTLYLDNYLELVQRSYTRVDTLADVA